MAPRMKWTVEQRTVVHLLRTQTSHTLEKQCAIFNNIFAVELRDSGYPSGLTLYRFRDEYNAKDKEGRSNVWKTVCAKKISAGEQARRTVLMNNINGAASEVGDDVAVQQGSSKKKRKINHTVSTTLDDQEDQTPSDDEQSTLEVYISAPIVPEPSVNAGTPGPSAFVNTVLPGPSASVNTTYTLHDPSPTVRSIPPGPPASTVSNPLGSSASANTTSTPPAAAPPLEMIHTIRSTTTWVGITPHSPSTAFLRHNDSVYQVGGHVVRAIIDGKPKDVMLCDAAHCAPCKLGENTKVVFAASRENKGLPFVHVSELYTEPGVGFYFVGGMDMRGQEFPRKQWKSTAMFFDALSGPRPVRLCVGAYCETCSGKEAVAKKMARYEPGGDLYDLKMRQQAQREQGQGQQGQDHGQGNRQGEGLGNGQGEGKGKGRAR